MKNYDLAVELSQADEKIIRSYECIKQRRLLSPSAMGYLTITNKRVVYQIAGKSLSGSSILVNEMPIEDAAAVNAYLGVSLNWLLFVVFAILSYVVLTFMTAVLPPFFTSWVFALILMLPFFVILLLTSNILNPDLQKQAYEFVESLHPENEKAEQLLANYSPIARTLFLIGLSVFGWFIVTKSGLMEIKLLGMIFLLALFFAVYLYTFGRPKTFNLSISSKTLKSTGINIIGDAFRVFMSSDGTTIDTLSASPATDAEKVARELGALLLDVRQLGDLGVEKWLSKSKGE